MKPWILGITLCLCHSISAVPLPESTPGPFAPPPPKLTGPTQPAQPMEPEPPALADCKNAPAILKSLGIALSDAQRTELSTRRFLLIPVEKTTLGENLPTSDEDKEYSFTQDEMIRAFTGLGGDSSSVYRNPSNARLITPDIVLHAWHKGFSRALEHIELLRLHAILTTFLEGTLENTRELRAATKDEPTALRLAWTEARFAAPWVLLGPPPIPTPLPGAEEDKEAPKPIPYAKSVSDRLTSASKGLPETVAVALKQEIQNVLAAEGFADSPLFVRYTPDKPSDYTQFKPRSHYTKSDALGGYFRAMMFLGRNGYEFSTSDAYGDAALATLAMARTTSKGAKPLDSWQQLMEITGFFAGQSDDITYTEFRTWIQETLGTATLDPTTATSPETAAKLAANVQNLRKPKIVSTGDLNQISSPDSTPPGFRIFGQRFTWDARILDRFTRDSPQAMPTLPTALMIPATFGDTLAEKIVRDKLATNPTHLATFNERLPKVRAELATVTDNDWFSSMAAKQLHVLSTLTPTRGKNFPAFMQSEAFAAKNLESQLGSFTQLKHDTVLYAKQVYAEMGEGGEDDKIPPVVKGLVQPDLPFWREMDRLARFAADGFSRHKLIPDAEEEFSRIRSFADDISALRKIAEKQAAGTKLTEAEWETIRTVNFEDMARPLNPYDEPKPGDGMCALVTDIATDAADGKILFEALGRPFVMLALIGGKDGNRMVAGMAYNHHEFSAPLSEGRLTDEQWQARIYRPDPQPIPRASWQAPITNPAPAPKKSE